jgi:hypothetical protein
MVFFALISQSAKFSSKTSGSLAKDYCRENAGLADAGGAKTLSVVEDFKGDHFSQGSESGFKYRIGAQT